MTKITMIYTFLRDEFPKKLFMEVFSATMDYYHLEGIEYSKGYVIGNSLISKENKVKICFMI